MARRVPRERVRSTVPCVEHPAIDLRKVRHAFWLGDGRRVAALHVDSLVVSAGEQLAVRGPSGSGKTTLLNVIAGLLEPTSGEVRTAGIDPFALRGWARDRLRARTIGYLFQDFQLLEPLTALENVALAASLAGRSRREGADAARSLLADLALGDRLEHRPAQLSAGERQRVAAARALVAGPAIVLCDEPTASLDARIAERMIAGVRVRCSAIGATLLVTSHDPAVLSGFERVVDLPVPKLAAE